MNLADNLVTSARDHGNNVATRLDEMTLSYLQLEDVSRRVAGLLAELGVSAGWTRTATTTLSTARRT